MTAQDTEALRIVLGDDERVVAAAGAAIREGTVALGLSAQSAESLVQLINIVCTRIASQSQRYGVQTHCEVALVLRPDALVVRIDDRGIPWQRGAHLIEQGSALSEILRQGAIKEVHFENRGRDGNRLDFLIQRPENESNLHLALTPNDHAAHLASPPVPADAPIRIRAMTPEDAVGVARCVYLSYGYTYDADWVYRPAAIHQMLASGMLHSCVAVSDDGEIVGHLALLKPAPNSDVVESGQAVVDPRYRGHHLLTSLKRAQAEWAAANGILGLYSEATAAHPISQKANIDLGAHETGLLLGYIPATVTYREIKGAAENHRRAVVMYYLKTNDGPARDVYAPTRHRELIARLFAAGSLHGRLATTPKKPDLGATTILEVQVRQDHNQAVISVNAYGADFKAAVGRHLRELCLHRVDCIYLDLPLADPATGTLGDQADDLGFIFGGVFPNRRRGGDVLRLQYLNNVEVSADDISVVSELGRSLFDYIQDSRPVERPLADRSR